MRSVRIARTVLVAKVRLFSLGFLFSIFSTHPLPFSEQAVLPAMDVRSAMIAPTALIAATAPCVRTALDAKVFALPYFNA